MKMTFAHFINVKKAQEHRSQYGGWLAVPNEGGFYWFDLSHTASKVMLHPAIAGLHVRLY